MAHESKVSPCLSGVSSAASSAFSGLSPPFAASSSSHSPDQQQQQQQHLPAARRKLEELNFDNLSLRALPIDKERKNYVRQVPSACFSLVEPTPVENPRLVAASLSALQLLDIDPAEVQRPDFAEYFSGNKVLPGARPAAHCYCGHQFGHFSGQLGDGATMYLGEVINSAGQRWELQFKGAGKTPYSRSADGRKVLRSSIREFLCSEAMYALGVPTTRAGTLVTSDTRVVRDIFYSGNPIHEAATIITRIAPTFLRFGSFEIVKPEDEITGRSGPSPNNTGILELLLDHTVQTYYPHIWNAHTESMPRYLAFYQEIVERTARLVAEWQCVGWCHGVLNTDNMSIVGVTIDYGPFGFMERYDPDFICNSSDDGGRYTYANQPEICKWNCMKLAEAMQLLVPLTSTKPLLERFDVVFREHYDKKMANKLGLISKHLDSDRQLVESLFATMERTGADFTNTFRGLALFDINAPPDQDPALAYLLTQCSSVEELAQAYAPRMQPQQLQMLLALAKDSPMLLMQLGLDPAVLQQEAARIEKSKQLAATPKSEKVNKDRAEWSKWFATYRARLLQEDCSPEGRQHRVHVMNSNNPRYVLRNYIAQSAIDKASAGDYSEVNDLLMMLSKPYEERQGCNVSFYDGPPHNGKVLRVT